MLHDAIQLDRRRQASMEDDQPAIDCCNVVVLDQGDAYSLDWQLNRLLCFCNLSQGSSHGQLKQSDPAGSLCNLATTYGRSMTEATSAVGPCRLPLQLSDRARSRRDRGGGGI